MISQMWIEARRVWTNKARWFSTQVRLIDDFHGLLHLNQSYEFCLNQVSKYDGFLKNLVEPAGPQQYEIERYLGYVDFLSFYEDFSEDFVPAEMALSMDINLDSLDVCEEPQLLDLCKVDEVWTTPNPYQVLQDDVSLGVSRILTPKAKFRDSPSYTPRSTIRNDKAGETSQVLPSECDVFVSTKKVFEFEGYDFWGWEEGLFVKYFGDVARSVSESEYWFWRHILVLDDINQNNDYEKFTKYTIELHCLRFVTKSVFNAV